MRNDERARVRAELAALDEPLRTTAVLYYFNDLSIDEIAEATGSQFRRGQVAAAQRAATPAPDARAAPR